MTIFQRLMRLFNRKKPSAISQVLAVRDSGEIGSAVVTWSSDQMADPEYFPSIKDIRDYRFQYKKPTDDGPGAA